MISINIITKNPSFIFKSSSSTIWWTSNPFLMNSWGKSASLWFRVWKTRICTPTARWRLTSMRSVMRSRSRSCSTASWWTWTSWRRPSIATLSYSRAWWRCVWLRRWTTPMWASSWSSGLSTTPQTRPSWRPSNASWPTPNATTKNFYPVFLTDLWYSCPEHSPWWKLKRICRWSQRSLRLSRKKTSSKTRCLCRVSRTSLGLCSSTSLPVRLCSTPCSQTQSKKMYSCLQKCVKLWTGSQWR